MVGVGRIKVCNKRPGIQDNARHYRPKSSKYFGLVDRSAGPSAPSSIRSFNRSCAVTFFGLAAFGSDWLPGGVLSITARNPSSRRSLSLRPLSAASDLARRRRSSGRSTVVLIYTSKHIYVSDARCGYHAASRISRTTGGPSILRGLV